MNERLPFLSLFFLVLFTQSLLAQQNPTVHLVGSAMRAPLDVPAGQTTVHLCDLTAGSSYSVTAIGMAAGQAADFEILPLANPQNITGVQEKKNTLHFTAATECVDIQVQATSLQPVTSIPMYLSVRCESCAKDQRWKEELLKEAGVSVLQVQGGISAANLITNTLIGGSCFNISNVTYAGQSSQIGTFSNGSTNLGFANGIMLTTGNIDVAPGPNDQDNANNGFGGGTPDADLSGLTSGSIVDRADIEFDFTPTVNSVSFDYVFASEEYCEYVNSQFNDVFGFFISGPGIVGTKNLAVVNANTPVSINTINHLTNSSLYVHNTPFFGANCGIPPSFGAAVNELQYDGFTKKLTAVVNVIPCQTYHIKLKIADVGDGLFDSGVFLRANSFAAGGSATVETAYPNGQSAVYEDCTSGAIRFVRNSGDISQPLTVNFTIGAASTATPGVDYAPLTSPVVIPAGQSELLVPVTVFGDQLTEGQESIILLVSNSCSCSQSQVNFLINDNSPLGIHLDDQTICSGSSATLAPTFSGGAAPLTFLWSNGSIKPFIVVSPAATTAYTVTITDACGDTIADTALVQVLPAIQTQLQLSFCPGDSVVYGGVTYTTSDTIVHLFPGTNGACDTIQTVILQLLPQPLTTDTIGFCFGSTVTIGGVNYTAPGVVQITLPGLNGSCDTLATYVLQLVQQFVVNDTIAFCAGDSVTLNGTTYTGAGTVMDTLPGMNGGCDTLATYVLQLLPQPTLRDTFYFCQGDSIHLDGQVYTQSGTVALTIPALSGCDTLATYVLQFTPLPVIQDTLQICQGDSIMLHGQVYSQSGTISFTLPGSSGCDTLVTYVLEFTPLPVIRDTLQICEGDSILLHGQVYSQSGMVSFTLPSLSGCDTLATYVLQFNPLPAFTKILSFCPGDSVTIGGTSYGQPDTITRVLPSASGCDTLATYVLQYLPQPAVTRVLEFCRGQSIQLAGIVYTRPDTVLLHLPSALGCDTLATYILRYTLPSGPTTLKVVCPQNITVTAEPGAATMPISYAPPTATTDCPCPGIQLSLQQGLVSGSNFPLGTTKICYNGLDSCANSVTCCFNVSVVESDPCDVKVINCIKYELLSITEDAQKRKTYRIRTTNNCTNRMISMFVQVPNGLVADLPHDNTIYTAPGGRTYLVRNPNFSPFYSVRYSSVSDSIQNGESDVFKYTLPPQISPNYIHVTVRLEPGIYYEAHLNTFFCEVGYDPNSSSGFGRPEDREAERPLLENDFNLFPNPTDGSLFADLSAWAGQFVQLRVFSAQGRLIQSVRMRAEEQAQLLELPASVAEGLYLLEVSPVEGKPLTRKFSVIR